MEQVAYRVHAFTRRGLLRVSGAVPRKGRAMTTYEGAQELRAPLALFPYEDVRGFFRMLDSGMRDLFLSDLAHEIRPLRAARLGGAAVPGRRRHHPAGSRPVRREVTPRPSCRTGPLRSC